VYFSLSLLLTSLSPMDIDNHLPLPCQIID